jgi:hypothetical protein
MADLFAARFPGRCADRGETISPGDLVAYVDDELVCGACADDELSRPGSRPEQVCRDCWLVHAGSCEDAR